MDVDGTVERLGCLEYRPELPAIVGMRVEDEAIDGAVQLVDCTCRILWSERCKPGKARRMAADHFGKLGIGRGCKVSALNICTAG